MAIIKGSVEVTKKAYDTSVAQQTADDAKKETIEINKTLTEVDKRVSDAQSKADESLEKAQEGFDKAEALTEKVDANTGAISTIKQTTAGLQTEVKSKADSSTVTQLADVVASKVSNVDFESNKTQTAELISSTVSLQNNENIRYLRFSGSGNSVNASTHVLEIEANDSDNKNIALGILPVAEKGSWTNLAYVTDGVSSDNGKYASGSVADKNVSFIIDLSKIYHTLNSLKLWMYVSAGRVYYNVKLEVSTDKKTWKVVYFKDNYTPTKKGDTVILSNAEASSQISQLVDNINLKVDTGDVINQINIDPKGVIISGKKISLDGDVSVLPGFKLKAETINGGTFNGNSFIKAIDIRTNDGNLPVEIKGKSSIDDAGIIIEQKTKDTTSGGIISDSRSILNNGLTVGTALDAANGDRRIDYTKDYSQVSSSGVITPNVVRTSDRALPYWNGTGSGDFSKESALIANGISVTGANFYIGVKTEARIVDEKGNVSGQTLTYKPIRASAFTVASSRDVKKNIEDWTGDALKLVNGTRVTEYNLKDENEDIDYKRIGLIVQESPIEIINFIGGDSIDLYEMASILWKSVQELDAKNKALEKEKNNLNERLSKIEGLLNLD
ncbi:hypothetical protein BFC20_10840 [Brochothrix thermosphacta]|uniref:tail fiber domain-containing protein n=1 Tax=Brochothrix thermosphacta TaxID=2756 RepID=UPI000E726FBB|nr:tail fiber domain-containing protein [Brochothrix thermosphacta]ANZ98163.1 hypothetical protein BFC20_10840 [Brochothrix thermosphacta]